MAVISIILIATNCFSFVSFDSCVLSPTDAILLSVLLISIFELKKDKHYFDVNKNSVVKLIIIILLYLAFQFFRTILCGIDTLINSLKVVRLQGILLLFFYCRTLTKKEYSLIFKIILFLSVIQGVFYFLQPLGVCVLQGVNDDALSEQRYANCCIFAPYFVLYFWNNKTIKINSRILGVLFFLGMILMAQVRGVIIALGICMITSAILSKDRKYITKTFVSLLLLLIVAIPVFKNRANDSSDFSSNLAAFVGGQDAFDLSLRRQSGSMSFRLFMLAERCAYLVENPQYALFGVGAIHEESNANKFDFIFGTVNERYNSGMCEIESGDITWVPIVLRYGFLGTLIFLLLMLFWVTSSVRLCQREKNKYIQIACLMTIFTLINSFDTTLFDSYKTITILCVFMGMTNIQENNVDEESKNSNFSITL